ncbi:MAG TPA: hypothetical protein EYN74_09235 [Nitrospirales bacterium]|nr:hypothetical protein [Nitrospirales bacterium]
MSISAVQGFLNRVIYLTTYVLKANKTFSVPGKAKILVVDEWRLDVLTPLFNGENYEVLYVRGEILNLNIVVICKVFINWAHGNSFFLSYAMAFLEIVKPSVVITFIDNNPQFQKLDEKMSCKAVKFVTIQNGTRVLSRDNPKGSRPIYHSNFFCFGRYEVDQYKGHGACVEAFHPCGSLIDSYYRASSRVKEKKVDVDLCLVSEGWHEFPCDDLLHGHARRAFERLMDYIRIFITRNERSLLVACRHGVDTREFSAEIDYLCAHLGKGTMCTPHDRQRWTSYSLTDNAHVVISENSTLMREAFGRGQKILACNYSGDEDYDFPVDGIWSLKEQGYSIFEERLLTLLSMDLASYRELSSAQALYSVGYSDASPTHLLLQSVIAEQLGNYRHNGH